MFDNPLGIEEILGAREGLDVKYGRFERQATAVLVIVAFALFDVSRYATQAYASPSPKIIESTPAPFSIPKELGTVDEIYRGEWGAGNRERRNESVSRSPSGRYDSSPRGVPVARHDRMVVYIQDAHDSLEAQENIAKIIQHLVVTQGVKTVFEEGYEGQVPTDKFFGFIKDPTIRQKVSYFLLDKLRIGGAEYAHINRHSRLDHRLQTTDHSQTNLQNCGLSTIDHGQDWQLIGVEDLKLYSENLQCYQRSAASRKDIEEDLGELFSQITLLANQYFSKALKSWLKRKELFSGGKLPLLSYLNEIQDLYLKGRQTRSAQSFAKEYPALSILLMAQITRDSELIKQLNALDFKVVFEEVRRLERDIAMTYLQTERDRDIFDFYQGLDLLKRLSRIELTQAEYEAAREALRELDTRKLADFIVSLTHRSLVLSKEWERHIKDAIRFYNVAQGRDRSIDDHLRDFIQNKDEDTAILVFGGFHANGIKEILKQQGLSYVVVSPKITSTDTRHKDYYKRLMSEGHYSFETPFLAARANKSPSSYVMATQMGDYPVERLLQAIASSVGTDNDPRLIERRLAAFNPSQKVQSISAAIETFNIRSEMRVLEEIYPAQDWEALEGMNDRYWAKYGGEFEKAKENDEQPGWFFDRLFGGLPQDAPILEIASGSGRALAVLREKGFTRLTGTDISEEAIAMAAAKGIAAMQGAKKTVKSLQEYHKDIK